MSNPHPPASAAPAPGAPTGPSPQGALPHRRTLSLAGLRLLAFLAWRNVWRNRLRSSLTVAGMVVGLTLMIAYLALVEGMFRQMVGFATNITIGHLQVHRQAYIDDQDLYALLPWPLVKHLEQTTPYRYAPRLYAAGLASAKSSSSGALLKAVDPERERQVTDLHKRLRRGTFELSGSEPVYPYGPNEPPVTAYPVVIGFNLARNLQVDVGDEMVLITQAADGSIGNGIFHVSGILQSIDPAFDRMGVLMSIQAFNSLMFLEDGVHELAVHVDDVSALDAARDRIAAAVQSWPGAAKLQEQPGGPVRVRTWMEINPPLFDIITSSQALVWVMGLIVFSLAAMGILNTMLMATYERRHELGILLSLGMGRGAMMLMVLLEAVFLSLFAAVVGTITGSGLAWYLQVEGFDYSRWLPEGLAFMGVVMEPVYYGHLLPEHLFISIAMLLAISLLAALVPSWRTARLRPAAALHQ